MDESGSPNGWDNQKIFVLGAVAVHEGQISTLTQSLDKIQAKYFPDVSVPIAFHAVDVYGGRGRFDRVDKETRMKLMKEIYGFIASIGYYLSALFTRLKRNLCETEILTCFRSFTTRD